MEYGGNEYDGDCSMEIMLFDTTGENIDAVTAGSVMWQ